MTTEMKKAFKLIKYGFQLKTNLVSAILVIVGAILMLAASSFSTHSVTPYILGSLYLLLGPMCLLQVQLSLLYSNIAKASPRAKMLEITLADFLSAAIALVGFTLIAAYTIIVNTLVPGTYPSAYLLAVALLGGTLLVYFSIAYKFFIISIIVMTVSVMFVFILTTILAETSLFGSFNMNLGISCVLGYIIIILNLLLSGFIRRVLHKFSFSKLAGGAKLRKQM